MVNLPKIKDTRLRPVLRASCILTYYRTLLSEGELYIDMLSDITFWGRVVYWHAMGCYFPRGGITSADKYDLFIFFAVPLFHIFILLFFLHIWLSFMLQWLVKMYNVFVSHYIVPNAIYNRHMWRMNLYVLLADEQWNIFIKGIEIWLNWLL
jgi:hypothetical protein